MILETERLIAEDLERLEQAIADRLLEEPKGIRERLARDHQIARFVDRFQDQSKRLFEIERDADGTRAKEIEAITRGDPLEEFYRQLNATKDFHRRYPNEPVENLERAYKRRAVEGQGGGSINIDALEIDSMFTGEEFNGRFLDMTENHTEYLNLPGVKRITYLQYLGILDKFDGFTKNQKTNDQYFQYLNGVSNYLEGFLRRTRPLSNPDGILSEFDREFDKEWEEGKITVFPPPKSSTAGPQKEHTPQNGDDKDIYCDVCIKHFANQKAYDNHLPGRKHKKALAAREEAGESTPAADGNPAVPPQEAEEAGKNKVIPTHKLKERAIAYREFRVQKLVALLSKEREDTKINVERKQSLTERERQMELEALLKESTSDPTTQPSISDDADSDNDSKIYNPLKLPLAWDGKPIPYWLYKLHGLGVEFPCEICGNFVYMGRRAFDKHFNEWRHTHGLRCLGITNTTLFREITKIDEAVKLWEKIQTDKKKEKVTQESVTEMEDEEGNVLPYQVWLDLKKQGLL